MFKKALTHSSYTRENELSQLENYERLEFFGDAVLKLYISEILFNKFPQYAVGELTKIRSIIVSDNMLAEVAKKIGLAELIILGKQEEKTGGRQRKSIIACAFEAVLGAYYTEGRHAEILNFLEQTFAPFIADVDGNFEKFTRRLAPGSPVFQHFHSAIFSYHPLKKTDIDLDDTITAFFDQDKIREVLHLINDTREINGIGESDFKGGVCWIAGIDSPIKTRER